MNRILETALLGLDRVRTLAFEDFSIDNRQFWDSLSDEVRADIIKQGEASAQADSGYISLALFRDFRKTGNRERLQEVYFAKRKDLSQLVIAECTEKCGRFLEAIEEAVWALLSEPSWVIPAHNSYIRDTEQLDTPLLERPVLDLFACETGEILALTKCTLAGRLNPVIVKDIEWALYNRIVLPYIKDCFWWMGGAGPLNNWSPWCTQNVLISSLSLSSLSESEKMKIVRQAVITLDSFIASYADDGGCDEGAGYYHAAALALSGAMLILERASERDFTPVFTNSKIKAMADFIEKVHVTGDIYLNYADCSPKAGSLSAREYLFAKRTENSAIMHHAAVDVKTSGWREDDNDYNLYYMLTGLYYLNEMTKEAEKDISFAKAPFTYFKATQLVIWREDDITFTVKGGCNAESHNHNDTGSIILYKGIKPLLVDIGVETYTKTTFSPLRYTLKPMQSGWHNLVNFPPVEQKDGAEYRAILIDEPDENSVTFDLRAAYERDERLRKYHRGVFFDRAGKTITVSEEIDSSLVPVLTLMSQEEPKFGKNTISYESFSIEFSNEVSFEMEVMNVTDERLRKAWPDRLYRSLVTLPGSTDWTITFT